MYRIMVWANREWSLINEGPWGDPDSAVTYAASEVGVPWIVVNEDFEPIEYGDSRGLFHERAKRVG